MMSVKKSGGSTALHLVFSAGAGALESCRKACTAGDSVFFLDNGVRQLLLGEPGKLLPPGVAIYYSGPDLEARGLAGPARENQVRVLGDEDFATLLLDHRHCLSWK